MRWSRRSSADPQTEKDLLALPVFGGRSTRRQVGHWLAALRAGADSPEESWPVAAPPLDGPPPAARWADRDPVAAARLARARAVMAALSEEHLMPVENLLQPETLRRLVWTPPTQPGADAVAEALTGLGARAWQVRLVAPAVAPVLPDPEPASPRTPRCRRPVRNDPVAPSRRPRSGN